MPNFSIKNIPEHIAEGLRQRAERNHRSLQGELMAILEQATREPVVPSWPATGPSELAYPRPGKSVAQVAAEHRAQYGEPVSDVPLAVDIIRAERDAR